jgi:hypothetical protein
MAATSSVFEEDGTTLLSFADGRLIRAPSALLYDASGNPLLTAPAALGNAAAGLLAVAPQAWNGQSFDSAPGIVNGTLAASAARTTTWLSANQTNPGTVGVMVFVNVTAIGGSASLQMKFRPQDQLSGQDLGINVGNAITATLGTAAYMFVIHPSIPTSPGNFYSTLQAPVPRIWTVQLVAATNDSVTYSVSYSYLR